MDGPLDHVYVIQQDHGPEDGGWGTAAVSIPALGLEPKPIVYGGDSPETIQKLRELCPALAALTGKETRLCIYRNREDVVVSKP